MWLVFGPPRTVNKRRLCGPLLGRCVHFIPAKRDLSAADRNALEAAVEILAETWRPKPRKLKK
jgi:hypothetical protein